MDKDRLSWLSKWGGTICTCLAVSLRSFEGMLGPDLILSVMGVLLWAYTAIHTKDTALLVINLVVLGLLLGGMYRFFLI